MSNKRKKPDVTLMTLLAYEATAESVAILEKYGYQKPKSYRELETELANLYFSVDDKKKLEKELADIHPHRKWLLKYVEPIIKEVMVEVPAQSKAPEIIESKSSMDGSLNQKSIGITSMELIALISVFGVVGMGFYAISRK